MTRWIGCAAAWLAHFSRFVAHAAVRPLMALGLALLMAGTAQASLRVDLPDGWRFRTDAKEAGVAQAWFKALPEGTRTVDVPHTWNVGADADFEGTAWYFKTLELPASLGPDATVELHFGATFYKARIWLNGTEVGRHEGGHTAYHFDITKLLRKGGANFLAVSIDNRPSATSIPGYSMRLAAGTSVWYDWWHYGGLVREVWLQVGEGALIRRQALDSELVGTLPQAPGGPLVAQVSTRVLLENPGRSAQRLALKTTVTGPDGRVVAQATGSAQLAAGAKDSSTLKFTIDRPVLWQVGDGQLYQVTTELRNAAGDLLDSQTDSLGLRRIEVRDRKLWVNGRTVRLTGLTRHQDSPWEGLAETRGTVLHDWNDLRALHTTLTRPVHYPQSKAVLDYADRHGILLVPEIPIWQFNEAQLKDPRLIALAQQMLTEMITSDGNHPSIFAWSVCNESDAKLPGGLAFVRTMKTLVRQLDPKRLVTFADSDLSIAPWPDSKAVHEVDFIMANAYFGSWSGASDSVDAWLDFMDRTYPDKMLIISEFGYPGPFSRNPVEADQQRIANLRQQLDAFAKRDFVAGAIFWIYQDYKSHRNLWTGETAGYVDHGVVDENRQRKPSYAAYQQRNAPLRSQLAWVQDEAGVSGFKAVLQANAPQQLPSYPLLNYRVEWRIVDRDGRLIGEGAQQLEDLAAPVTVQGRWPVEKNPQDATLKLRVTAPDGAVAHDARLNYGQLRFGSAVYPGGPDAAAFKPAP